MHYDSPVPIQWIDRLDAPVGAPSASWARTMRHSAYPPCCSCCSPRQPAPPQHIPSPTRAPAATPPGQSRAQLSRLCGGSWGGFSGCGAVDALRDSCRAASTKRRAMPLEQVTTQARARAAPNEDGRAGNGPGSIGRVLIQTIEGGACDALGDGAGIGVRIIAPTSSINHWGAGGAGAPS